MYSGEKSFVYEECRKEFARKVSLKRKIVFPSISGMLEIYELNKVYIYIKY